MKFENRHIGITSDSEALMLKEIGSASLEELTKKTMPPNINYTIKPFQELSEQEFESHIQKIAKKNTITKSYIGQGYSPNYCPSIIRRNILENPSWYTQYTPYQSEISQGRMEALLNFQTVITELTGLDIANASLLDEGNACSEAIFMAYQNQRKKNNQVLLVTDLFDASIDVIKSRFKFLDIKFKCVNFEDLKIEDETSFAIIGQFPAKSGKLNDYTNIFNQCKQKGISTILATDPLALTLYKSPEEMGADIAVGSAQRFGVPLGFGGPSAGFIACVDSLKRLLPGRIIGVSKDRHNNIAYRMALQTREQHIRREKATSNICTSQALLAIINSFYAIYHGPKGLIDIAKRIKNNANILAQTLLNNNYQINHECFFDTISITTENAENLTKKALKKNIEWYCPDKKTIQISINECTTIQDIEEILLLFEINAHEPIPIEIDQGFSRKTDFLNQPVFNKFHSETKLLRYIKSLEKKDLSLTDSMIPLGSCTMKLNATTELLPISYPEFSNIHPHTNPIFSKGYLEVINKLELFLSDITGFTKTSLQPNSGAQGEFAGLMCIRSYFESINESHRNIALVPTSAHGTNPASASLCGFKIVHIKCNSDGAICETDLKEKCIKYSNNLAVIMITYPSTFGVFDQNIKEICNLIHSHGAQVYMDGANMNAQVGLTSPYTIGADVCHLNLHKTFCIPHGGGGPGVGPICVAKHLAEFLPNDKPRSQSLKENEYIISSAPFGSASILLISYAYIKLMGSNSLKKATQIAILNANFIAKKLSKMYSIMFSNEHGYVAHELIIDCRAFKKDCGITVEDIAKRLIDYGFHAPTMSWPVADTLMIEPTESEGLNEINRFIDAMISIREEIQKIYDKKILESESPLKNAPHSMNDISSNWKYKYSSKEAFFPNKNNDQFSTKFWPSVSRVDNAHGDRNLICTCGPIKNTQDEVDIVEKHNNLKKKSNITKQ